MPESSPQTCTYGFPVKRSIAGPGDISPHRASAGAKTLWFQSSRLRTHQQAAGGVPSGDRVQAWPRLPAAILAELTARRRRSRAEINHAWVVSPDGGRPLGCRAGNCWPPAAAAERVGRAWAPRPRAYVALLGHLPHPAQLTRTAYGHATQCAFCACECSRLQLCFSTQYVSSCAIIEQAGESRSRTCYSGALESWPCSRMRRASSTTATCQANRCRWSEFIHPHRLQGRCRDAIRNNRKP